MRRYWSLIFGLAGVLLSTSLFSTASAADTRHKWAQESDKACERGSMQDCLLLAVSYARGDYLGKKIEKDSKLSKNYTDRSIELGTNGCRQGNLKFCYMLGVLYFEGELVDTNFQKGIEHANKACTGGYKEACEWLKNSGL